MNFQNRDIKAVQSGRSFYVRPSRPKDLSNFCDMWIGLFQATMLGTVPYINIDIAHKAFTREVFVLDMLREFQNTIRWGPRFTPGQPLPDNYMQALNGALRGYTIAYQRDRSSPLITKMCMGLSGPAKDARFMHQDKMITVEQYFRDMKCPLKQPAYPCIIGPNKSYFPIEFCSLVGGQVCTRSIFGLDCCDFGFLNCFNVACRRFAGKPMTSKRER